MLTFLGGGEEGSLFFLWKGGLSDPFVRLSLPNKLWTLCPPSVTFVRRMLLWFCEIKQLSLEADN